MSLQGSLETFALPDVLVLLSSTKKDGELRVVAGRVDGRVWLEKGQIVHSAVGGKETKAVDALFELLRLDAGTFNFEADSPSPSRSEPEMIDLVLADAQVRLGEWNEIAKVVPHLDAVIDMAVDAPREEVIVSREQWSLLRRVAGGSSAHDLMVALGRSEFDTCKAIKDLVDSQLATIDVDAAPKRKTAPAEPADKRDEDAGDDLAEQAASLAAEAAAAASEAAADKDGPAKPSKVERERSDVAAASSRREEAGEPSKDVKQDDLDALAELASRPRKARASTAIDADLDAGSHRSAATKVLETNGHPAEEAKALVAQLAALSGDDEEAVAAKVVEHLASGGELPDVPEGDEPINRGLLLKFLSSVRN